MKVAEILLKGPDILNNAVQIYLINKKYFNKIILLKQNVFKLTFYYFMLGFYLFLKIF